MFPSREHGAGQSKQDATANERTPLINTPTTSGTETLHDGSERPLATVNGIEPHPAPENSTTSTLRLAVCSVVLAILIILQSTNITILTTTQSAIAKDLDVYEQTSWLTSAFMIAFASVTPLSGKLASVFSPRTSILAAPCILALGTGISSIAHSFGVFVLGRAVAGIGAGGVYVVGIMVVLELSGHKRRGLGLGILHSGYTFGVAVGATLAGALLPKTGWRALFWMQIPIAITSGLIMFFSIPASIRSTGSENDSSKTMYSRLANLDYFGAVTLTTSIVLLLYALSSPKRIPLLPIALSAVVFTTFVLNEMHLASDPIIPITLLKSRGLLLTCLASTGYMMARWSVLFFTPTYAIAVRLWTPAQAGSILIPTNVGFAVGGLAVGWLHIRKHRSFYVATLVAYGLFPLTVLALSQLCTQETSIPLIVLIVFLNGVLAGATVNYSLAHILHLTPPSTHYTATALAGTFRGFAGSFGSAIGGGLFTRTLSQALELRFEESNLFGREDTIRELLGQPAAIARLSDVEREAAILGYQDSLKTLFLASAGLAFVMIFVQAGAGSRAAIEDKSDDRNGEERTTPVANGSARREIADA